MEENQLYLKRKGDGCEFEFALKPFDVSLMSDEYFLFKKVAVVMLYPNGNMEAMRSGGGFHHNYYYMKAVREVREI